MNRTIYGFEVFSHLEAGKDVYVVDMATATIRKVNEMTVDEYLKVTKEDNDNYIFYTWFEEGEK